MSQNKIRRRASERGLATILVIFMSVILAGLCFGLLQEGLAARTSLNHHTNNLRALELAEIGLVRAEMEIRYGRPGEMSDAAIRIAYDHYYPVCRPGGAEGDSAWTQSPLFDCSGVMEAEHEQAENRCPRST